MSRLKRIAWTVAPCAPVLLLALIMFYVGVCNPKVVCGPLLVDARMASERAIAPDRELDPLPPIVRTFRYEPTGTELGAGVPYWIFRALPRLFPDVFVEQEAGHAWEKFGLLSDADPAIARDNGVPRGMVIADSELQLPGVRIGIRLKRVAFNCAGCHQGEYLDADGGRVLVDGMPNHVADTQAFKAFIRHAFGDPRFTVDNVLAAIDAELAASGRPALDRWERFVYGNLVGYLRKKGIQPGAWWMDKRPLNGPGRIDAFSAVKYETLDAPDTGGNATVDLPSLWNQGKAIRPWHHWDGNTQDQRARNYGSVVGVGGSAMSVRGVNVDAVGAWLNQQLPPPKFPFARPSPAGGDTPVAIEARRARGRAVYDQHCQACHGVYDPASRSVAPGPRYMTVVDVGTDPERWKAFDPATAKVLNDWGARFGIWAPDAFRPASKGYLAGPLDGIWARAPYLHNGSVPSLRALITKDARPVSFYRGSRHYDPAAMGWEWAAPRERDTARALFQYDTRDPGNSSQGHPFYVDDPADVDAVLDYLATL